MNSTATRRVACGSTHSACKPFPTAGVEHVRARVRRRRAFAAEPDCDPEDPCGQHHARGARARVARMRGVAGGPSSLPVRRPSVAEGTGYCVTGYRTVADRTPQNAAGERMPCWALCREDGMPCEISCRRGCAVVTVGARICARTRPTATRVTSAPGRGSPHCHICTRIRLPGSSSRELS